MSPATYRLTAADLLPPGEIGVVREIYESGFPPHQLGPTGWVFLRYFVVAAERRGQGLGGILWERLTDTLQDAGYTLLVFDVEDPGERGIPAGQARIRSRRIAFYRRHGAALLPVTGYRNPHEGSGDGGWSPMLLLAAGLTAGDPPTASAAGLRAVVGAVYRYRWSLPPGGFSDEEAR